MKKFQNLFVPAAACLLFLIIFKGWLTPGVLSGGDWPFLYPQAVNEVVPLSVWDILFNNGIGMNALPKIWFDSYSLTIVKIANILTWPIFERVVWYFPYLLISFFGAFSLSKKFLENNNFRILSGLIYSLNSYSLLVLSGGQAGVFIAYAFMPFAFLSLFNLFEDLSIKRSIVFSLITSLLVLLDLRVAYVFLMCLGILGLIFLIYNGDHFFKKVLYYYVLPAVIGFALHMFWMLPIVIMGRSPAAELGDIYTSSASLSFFSFANLENSIGLLHPNWPENLFGKVAFLRPEFLIVGILAFSSLLFISNEKKEKRILLLSVCVIVIMGIFLAKGVNDPFGSVYQFFFNSIPGFVMFRDPTKWYMLVAIAYSILIPYTLQKVSSMQNSVFRKSHSILITQYSILIPAVFLLFWGILIRDAYNGTLKGTLIPRQIPANYQKLADVLTADKSFNRTLWVPVYPTLAYVSNTHPAVPAVEFFQATSTANLISILQSSKARQALVDSGVKYVIVPEDIYGKIFLTDRKYDERVYKKTLEAVANIDYLTKVDGYGKIGVFEVANPKGHFWGIGENMSVTTKYISPTEYEVTVGNVKKGDKLIFAENFDSLWKAKTDQYSVSSIQYPVSRSQKFNSFELPENGSFTLRVYYEPQGWFNIGLVVSGVSLVVILSTLIYLKPYRVKN